MVKIDARGIQEKLKMGKVGKLIKEVFGNSFEIIYSDFNKITVQEKDFDDFSFVIALEKNEFHLRNRKYFNKTKELAEKYEQLFLGDKKEVTIKTRYFKK